MRLRTAGRGLANDAAETSQAAARDALLLGDPADDLGSGVLLHGELGGRPVLVRRLTVDGDARSRAHAMVLARQLLEVEHPHLLPLVDVRADWEGIDLIYDDSEADGSLAGLLGRRRLGAPEVVGIGLAVGEALACLHDADLTHGRLTATDLLVSPDGGVLVNGYGVAGVLGSAGLPAEDVRDLVDLLLACLGGEDGFGSGPLRQLLRELAGTPGLDADGLVEALRSLPSAPVGSTRRPSEPVVRRPHRVRTGSLLRRLPAPRMGWRVLGAVLPASLGVLLLAGWLGASLPSAAGESMTGRPDAAGTPSVGPTPIRPPAATSSPERTSSPEPTSAPKPSSAPDPSAPSDWRTVLTGLNEARSELFAAPDERRLASIDVPGSSAYAADLALLRDLIRSGAASRGLRTDLVSVQVRSAGPTRADLVVADVLRPYTIVRATGTDSGRVLQQRLGRSQRTTVMVLVRAEGQWRVAEVRSP